MHAKHTTARRRAGFTLVELMVVMLIISVLVALSAAATIRLMSTQQASNTKATLTKLDKLLQSQWSTVTRLASGENIPTAVQTSLQAYQGNDANAARRLRVLYIKLRQRQEFPMTFAEALSPACGLPALPKFSNYFKARGYTTVPPSQPGESAILLLIALQSNLSGGGVNQDDLGGATVGIVPLASGQLAEGLLDGWGTPLTFTRYPIGNPIVNAAGPVTGGKSQDPDDSDNLLMNPSWTGRATFQLLLPTPPAGLQIFPSGKSYRLAPLIASSGPDKSLGLDPVTFTRLGPDADDDLYSKQ